MKRKSASTLIYFTDRERKKRLVKHPKHVNKEKRTRHVKRFSVVSFLLLALGFGAWVYKTYRPLDVTMVTVTGAQRFVSAQDVQKIAEARALGKNLIFLDIDDLETTITSSFLASKSVKIRRQLPKSLKVEVTERVPIALIQSQDKAITSPVSVFYFVDADGFVLGLADKSATNLPVINYSQQVEVGKFVDSSAVAYYFDLLKALDDEGISASTISSYPKYTQFFTRDDNKVFVNNAQSAKSQIKIFAKMLEAFKSEGKKVKQIDLRFDKVIVEFVNDQEEN
jgi:cell division protein FtsQ